MRSDFWVILLSGDITPTERLHAQVQGARVIAADAGMRHAEALGLHPECWIGDFDSAPGELLARHADVPRIAHPADKDMTDGALAIAHALERGARDLLLVGALGGRSDHAMMHLMQLADLAARGIRARASSGMEEALGLAPGEHVIDLPAGSTFSIIGLDDLKDVTLTGARWPLKGEDLPFGHSRPVSNVAEGPVTLHIGAGRGILLATPA